MAPSFREQSITVLYSLLSQLFTSNSESIQKCHKTMDESSAVVTTVTPPTSIDTGTHNETSSPSDGPPASTVTLTTAVKPSELEPNSQIESDHKQQHQQHHHHHHSHYQQTSSPSSICESSDIVDCSFPSRSEYSSSCSPTPTSIELLVINVVDELLFTDHKHKATVTATEQNHPLVGDSTANHNRRSRVYRSNSANSAIVNDTLRLQNTVSSVSPSYDSSSSLPFTAFSDFTTSEQKLSKNRTDNGDDDEIIDEIVIVYPDRSVIEKHNSSEHEVIINHIPTTTVPSTIVTPTIDNDHTVDRNDRRHQKSKSFSLLNSEQQQQQQQQHHHTFIQTFSDHSTQLNNNICNNNHHNRNKLLRRKHLKSTPSLHICDPTTIQPSPCPSPTSCPALPYCFNTVTFDLCGPDNIAEQENCFNFCLLNNSDTVISSATAIAGHDTSKRVNSIINNNSSENSVPHNNTIDSSASDVSPLSPTTTTTTSGSGLGHCVRRTVSHNSTIVNSNSIDNRSNRFENTLHKIPPSVVISDHSLDEVRVVHDYDLNYNSNQLSTSQMNPGNDLGNYLLSGNNIRRDSLASICSSTSSLSSLGEGDDFICDGQFCCSDDSLSTTNLNTSPWRKIRSLVTSPFIQTYKRQKYPWIQLAGHQGNFMAGHSQGTILKKLSGNEKRCFEKLMSDVHLKEFVPEYKETTTNSAGEVYLELEDLLAQFTNPSIMDIKMGLRTYLEEELIKAGEKPKLRKDMYEKMVAIDPEEPKPEEHSLKAITKPRYMIWRESISSTSTLGFRIDGVKLRSTGENNNCTRMVKHDFKRTKTEDSVRTSIELFADKDHRILCKYYQCLKKIRKSLILSDFFREHEMIGSSLLFVHDDNNANIWMIDFAKTYPLPEGVKIDHCSPWTLGNHEDGYLVGLDNLIRIFGQLCDNVQQLSNERTVTAIADDRPLESDKDNVKYDNNCHNTGNSITLQNRENILHGMPVRDNSSISEL